MESKFESAVESHHEEGEKVDHPKEHDHHRTANHGIVDAAAYFRGK